MKELLFEFARRMKWIHDLIANFSAGHFNDKELHFIVLGITGMIIFAVTFPIFSLFDKWDNSFAMASLYTVVITVIMTISLALMIDLTHASIIIPLVIGIFVFIVSYRVFNFWDNRDQPMPITNFFAMTMIVIFAFAIELFQGLTNTGSMELADAIAGIAGYIAMYIVLRIVVFIYQLLCRLFSHKKGH